MTQIDRENAHVRTLTGPDPGYPRNASAYFHSPPGTPESAPHSAPLHLFSFPLLRPSPRPLLHIHSSPLSLPYQLGLPNQYPSPLNPDSYTRHSYSSPPPAATSGPSYSAAPPLPPPVSSSDTISRSPATPLKYPVPPAPIALLDSTLYRDRCYRPLPIVRLHRQASNVLNFYGLGFSEQFLGVGSQLLRVGGLKREGSGGGTSTLRLVGRVEGW